MPLSQKLLRNTLISCSLSLCSFAINSAETTKTLTEAEIDHFMASIQGTWDGRAIETPAGPMDYDITFHSCNSNKIAGITELQVSNHHWQFWRSNDELYLSFLSTFRGNQNPIQLIANKIKKNAIHFHATKLALLTVVVIPTDHYFDFRIFHHKKPHVHIRLSQSTRQINNKKFSENRRSACITFQSQKTNKTQNNISERF